ncbi:MAG: Si-specific NAD(P)(+) transhydrogenase [Alphaproteobacteria bacterium]|nr:Si-specific NAD(P)(+) transhydrogenase [Alphaproteobacteria bacterium]
MSSYDLIVIGSGPAGRRASIQAAKLGKSVMVVDRRNQVGGVSVHTGTIPSKTLRETVLNLSGFRERGFYGRSYRVKKEITADDLRQRLSLTLDHEVETLEHQFVRNQVTTLTGHARFVDPHTIEVRTPDDDSVRLSASRFLIAVGTKPFRPDNIPFDGQTVFDSDEILSIATLPKTLAVIGAGVIGLEYATIFSALDIQVTLIEPRKTMLDFIDREIIEELTHELRQRGMILRFGCKTTSIERESGGGCRIQLEDGRLVRADAVLFAAGRMGATDDLNLDAAGLAADQRGRIAVGSHGFRTAVPHIYAAGDVIGFPSLASTSMEQGRIAACRAFDHPSHDAPAFFPYGIYAVPEVSTIGKTEEEVRFRDTPFECGIARFRETSRGQIMGLSSGFMKMIFGLEDRRLLGVHIVGEGATELIHIGQAVLNLGGTVDYFVENTFNYPTLAEAYKIAALDAWNRMPKADDAVVKSIAS